MPWGAGPVVVVLRDRACVAGCEQVGERSPAPGGAKNIFILSSPLGPAPPRYAIIRKEIVQ